MIHPASHPIEPEAVPPLTIPKELWARLPDAQRRALRRAAAVLDAFSEDERVSSLRALAARTGLSAEEILHAIAALEGMSLVSAGVDGKDVVVRLVARPDEHVRIVGPDGNVRWLFVAKPVVAPEWDPADVN